MLKLSNNKRRSSFRVMEMTEGVLRDRGNKRRQGHERKSCFLSETRSRKEIVFPFVTLSPFVTLFQRPHSIAFGDRVSCGDRVSFRDLVSFCDLVSAATLYCLW